MDTDAGRRLSAILDGMPVLIDAFDEQGIIIGWNAECERVTGYAAAEIVGNPRAMALLYPDPAYLAELLADAEGNRAAQYSRVLSLRAKDGSERVVQWFNVGARFPVPGWHEWSVGIDVTERSRLEAALGQAARVEREQLGRELHDALGQELTGLSLLADSLARRHRGALPQLATDLQEIAAIARGAVASCQDIARGLALFAVGSEGLAQALRALARRRSGAAGPLLEYGERIDAAVLLPVDACHNLYRIAQEAVANAIRHAHARHIRIRLEVDDQVIRLEITDDGIGIAASPPVPSGLGLSSMRQRAMAIGALFEAGNAPAGGTVVCCTCPNRSARTLHPIPEGQRSWPMPTGS